MENIVHNFADVVAEAYISQYIKNEGVMGMPVVYFDGRDFFWTSSLVSGPENWVAVEKVEKGMFGDLGGLSPEEAYDVLTDYIIETVTAHDLTSLIEFGGIKV
jgi:hypothetical protein